MHKPSFLQCLHSEKSSIAFLAGLALFTRVILLGFAGSILADPALAQLQVHCTPSGYAPVPLEDRQAQTGAECPCGTTCPHSLPFKEKGVGGEWFYNLSSDPVWLSIVLNKTPPLKAGASAQSHSIRAPPLNKVAPLNQI